MEYTVSAEEVKRVKGLGFLQDKRYPDVFNARVITRNGKLTAEQHRVIADASEKFGSGVVTMTTRLTLEVQGIRYDNIQPFLDFLAAHGLTTGGTGKRVRPVVSCKGTTCQYGLIATTASSPTSTIWASSVSACRLSASTSAAAARSVRSSSPAPSRLPASREGRSISPMIATTAAGAKDAARSAP